MNVQLYDIGLQPYKTVWDFQETLFAQTVAEKTHNRDNPDAAPVAVNNHLIFCQHPHVYTLGNSGSERNLLLDQQGLANAEAEFYKTNRGGDITYHGPGQLVGYPIFDLDYFYTDIHKFLRELENAIIDVLKTYGIIGEPYDGYTGVWIDVGKPGLERKICAIGVRCSRWVTMHGFALNVNTNLSYFDNIIPCGIVGKNVTSIAQEVGYAVDIDVVKNQVLQAFAAKFGVTFVPASAELFAV